MTAEVYKDFLPNTLLNQLLGHILTQPHYYGHTSIFEKDKLKPRWYICELDDDLFLSRCILGFIIERVSNFSLQEYLDINVFKKLGMKDTAFTLDQSKKDRITNCYRWNENNKLYELHYERPDPNITVNSYLEEPNSFSAK